MIHSTWQCFKSWSNESESCHDSWLELTGYYRSNEQKLSSTLIKGHQKLNRLKTDECLGRQTRARVATVINPRSHTAWFDLDITEGFPSGGGGVRVHFTESVHSFVPLFPTKISPYSLVPPQRFHHVPLFPQKYFTMFPCFPTKISPCSLVPHKGFAMFPCFPSLHACSLFPAMIFLTLSPYSHCKICLVS